MQTGPLGPPMIGGAPPPAKGGIDPPWFEHPLCSWKSCASVSASFFISPPSPSRPIRKPLPRSAWFSTAAEKILAFSSVSSRSEQRTKEKRDFPREVPRVFVRYTNNAQSPSRPFWQKISLSWPSAFPFWLLLWLSRTSLPYLDIPI